MVEKSKKMKRNNFYFKITGFTLIETIIVVAIIGILSTFILVSLFGTRQKARDAKRKLEISQIGRFLTTACYLPESGAGEYDLISLANELLIKYPQYSNYFAQIPRDPKTGTETESKYIYTVNAEGTKCALYANLENENETPTLTITVPAPGGGTGVLKADNPGWNGTSFYFQVSN